MSSVIVLGNGANKLTATKVVIVDDLDEALLRTDELKTIDRSDTKCGDVRFGERGMLMIVCALCKDVFKNLKEFGIHIQEAHIKLKDLNEYPEIDGSSMDNHNEEESFCNSPIKTEFSQEEIIEDAEYVSSAYSSTSEIKMETNLKTSRTSSKVRRKTQSILENFDDIETEDGEPVEPNVIESKDRKKKFSCNLCKSVYKYRSSLIRHCKRTHGNINLDAIQTLFPSKKDPKTVLKQYQCSACKRVYSQNKTLLRHIREMHVGESVVAIKMAKVCKYCDKEFNNQEIYATHIKEDHPGNNKYLCPHCPNTFSCKERRKEHINTHTGERPFKCPHCSHSFNGKKNLKRHLLWHFKIRKYPCSLCGKLFVTTRDRKRHESTHTGKERRQCDQCGKIYSNKCQLMQHLRIHQNIRNYKCEICSKTFFTSTHLNSHKRVHSDERPFVCDICGQGFRHSGNLRAHRDLHSDVKKYVCKICGKAFSQFIGLCSHRKSHGKIG